jgi:trigger factor
LLERQSEREFRRAIMELQRSGYPDEDIRSQLNFLRQNSRTSTAQALKEHFILEKIAEIEGIEETQEHYDTEISLIATQSGVTPRRVRAQIEKSGDMDILRNQIIERKVIDLIAASASFKEVPFNFEDSDEEAIDFAASGEGEIAEVTKEDLKAVHKEIGEKKMIDPNTKVQ